MVNFNTAFFHNGFNAAGRNTVSDVGKNGVENDIFWKVSAFKTDYLIFQLLKLTNVATEPINLSSIRVK